MLNATKAFIDESPYETPVNPTLLELLTDRIMAGMPIEEAQAIVHRNVYYRANKVVPWPKFKRVHVLDNPKDAA